MTDEFKELIDSVAAVLLAEGAREVYLFGSAISGKMRDDSDIDVAVAGLPPERFFRAMGRAGDVLKRPLDLIDLDEDNPFTRYLKDEGEFMRVG